MLSHCITLFKTAKSAVFSFSDGICNDMDRKDKCDVLVHNERDGQMYKNMDTKEMVFIPLVVLQFEKTRSLQYRCLISQSALRVLLLKA